MREIVEAIEIAAPAERVFRALTTASDLMLWWSDPGTYPALDWSLDARPGGAWLSRWSDPDGNEFSLGGQIVEIEPPHLLVYTWWDERYPDRPHTQVRYDVTSTAAGTHVRVTHSGFDDARADYEDYRNGWWRVLEKLRTHAQLKPAFYGNRDVAIEVTDLAAAEKLYVEHMGLRVCARDDTHLHLDAGSFSLWINRSSGVEIGFIPSFDVADARAARKTLEAGGCRITRQSADGRSFYAEDPFGLVFDVIEVAAATSAE